MLDGWRLHVITCGGFASYFQGGGRSHSFADDAQAVACEHVKLHKYLCYAIIGARICSRKQEWSLAMQVMRKASRTDAIQAMWKADAIQRKTDVDRCA